MNDDLSGFRLLRWEYGLIADLPKTPKFSKIYSYYFALVFVKNQGLQSELFPTTLKNISLCYLSKIVDFVEREPGFGLRKIVFTDGTFLDIS
jgi:hypothetical protein